jgi:hypothetical protein
MDWLDLITKVWAAITPVILVVLWWRNRTRPRVRAEMINLAYPPQVEVPTDRMGGPLHYCWHVHVQNRGKGEIKDMMLHFPASGIYTTDKAKKGETWEIDEQGEIKLGDMRGRASITVSIWTPTYVGVRRSDIYVSYTAGSVSAQVGKTYYGLAATMGEMFTTGTVLYWSVLLGIAVFVSVFSYKLHSTRYSPSTNQTITR